MSTDYTSHDSFHFDSHSHLIGNEVQVYKGGPESQVGKLIDAQSDYITLYVEKSKSIIYYNADHIKNISENVKGSAYSDSEQEEEISFVKANNFQSLLKHLVNQYIHVNQGGPEKGHGYLVAAAEDYIVLFTKGDGFVFFNIAHIKSVHVTPEKEQTEETTHFDYVKASSFHDVFRHMIHKWVSINRGGPDAVEGILSEGSGGHYVLIHNDEVLRVYPRHIKSISFGPKGSFKKKTENEKNSNQSEENETNENSNDQTTSKDKESSGYEKSNYEKSNRESEKSRDRYAYETVIESRDYYWKPRRRY